MRIAIIGAGITGLRAGLELAANHDVTLIEKSAGVGGRLSTRRVGEVFINHGAEKFDRAEKLFENDSVAEKYRDHFKLQPAATALPKNMRDDLLALGAKLMLNTEISSVTDKKIFLPNRNMLSFEAILITCPVPQVRKLLNAEILPLITYTKVVRFIGVKNGQSHIEDVPSHLVEEIFELPEEEIRARFNVDPDLMVKKWRYARVKDGIAKSFRKITDRLLIAGDAFDPEGHYDLYSAWASGQAAGMFLN